LREGLSILASFVADPFNARPIAPSRHRGKTHTVAVALLRGVSASSRESD
jgi:hypothetical protein